MPLDKSGSIGQDDFFSRLPNHVDPNIVLSQIEKLQGPCPWGDLSKREGMTRARCPRFPEDPLNYRNFKIPEIPIALALGCGDRPDEMAHAYNASNNSFGLFLPSDKENPALLHVDLTDPETISLNGNKVHAILSICVFTEDGLGVTFKSPENMDACATAIDNLLMPGGIIANSNFANATGFEDRMVELFGYTRIPDPLGIVILQKPF